MTNSSSPKSNRVEIANDVHTRTYFETLTIGQHLCTIEISSDTYRCQCLARARVWSRADLRWNDVTNIHFSLMTTKEGLVYKEGVGPDDFAVDRDELTRRLEEILS